MALPFFAALGGAWAFSRPQFAEVSVNLAVALALVVGGWQQFWRALTHTDWAAPLQQWRGWTKAASLPAWPYIQPGTPGAALHHRLSQMRAWWQDVGKATLSAPLQRAVLAILISLLLGVAVGRLALLLSLCFVTLTELAVLWHEGDGEVGTLWTGITLVGLPWILGGTLTGADLWQPAISGLALALTVGLFAKRSWWALAGPIVGATFLIWQGRASAAGWLLLLALPGLIVLSQRPSKEGYRRSIGPWVVAMVALVAWVL